MDSQHKELIALIDNKLLQLKNAAGLAHDSYLDAEDGDEDGLWRARDCLTNALTIIKQIQGHNESVDKGAEPIKRKELITLKYAIDNAMREVAECGIVDYDTEAALSLIERQYEHVRGQFDRLMS